MAELLSGIKFELDLITVDAVEFCNTTYFHCVSFFFSNFLEAC